MRILWVTCLACVGLLLTGCGTSNMDICHAQCEWGYRCLKASDSNTANCNNECDNKKGTLQDADDKQDRECSNSSDIREKTLHCYQLECDLLAFAKCLNQVPGCISK